LFNLKNHRPTDRLKTYNSNTKDSLQKSVAKFELSSRVMYTVVIKRMRVKHETGKIVCNIYKRL